MRRWSAFCVAILCAVASGQSFPNPHYIPLGFDPATVVAGDLNGDGRPDIIYGTGLTANGVMVPMLAQADGTYLPGVSLSLSAQISPICKVSNVNGDSKLDLICAGYPSTQPSIALFLGNGDGTFQSPILIQLASTSQNSALVVAAAGDLNNDGNIDLIVTDAGNSIITSLLGDGTGHFRQGVVLHVSEVPAVAALADINGDGKLDMVESGIGNGVGVYAGNGDGTFSLTADYPSSTLPYWGTSMGMATWT